MGGQLIKDLCSRGVQVYALVRSPQSSKAVVAKGTYEHAIKKTTTAQLESVSFGHSTKKPFILLYWIIQYNCHLFLIDITPSSGATPVIGDLHNISAMARGMEGCDVIFHCASSLGVNIDDHESLHRDNVIGTSNIVRAAVSAGMI